MIISPNPIDYLKYLVAEVNPLLESVADDVIDADRLSDAAAERIAELLRAARVSIVEAAAVFCRGDDMNHYSNGRSVSTSIELEQGCYFTFSWHPQPDHRDNRPRELCTVDNRDGSRQSIMVRGNNVIEAVPVAGPYLKAVK